MRPFRYHRPASSADALTALGAPDSVAFGGGTDLLVTMKEGLAEPAHLVDVRHLRGARDITVRADGSARIGGGVRIADLAAHGVIRERFAALAEAAGLVGTPALRNMSTIAGNLCQRPRCWYYRQGFGLLAMKDGKSLVPDGANLYHAIFGGGPAYFVSASSLGPALVALGAKIKLVSAKGPREVPAASFFVAPQDETSREIALHPDEILTEIMIPAGAVRSATYEVRQREVLDWPLVTASVVLHMRGNVVASAKVVMGYVACKPWDSAEAAKALAGKAITAETAEGAGKAAVSSAQPLSQNAYKVTLARVAVKRALLEAAKQKA